MAQPLKEANRFYLAGVLVLNIIVYLSLTGHNSVIFGSWQSIISDPVIALPGAVCLALVGILNAIIPSETKAAIVYTRRKNPLPGCQAFTRYARIDSRISFEELEKHFGPFPREPREQNALWYRLYKTVDNDTAVTHTHRNFLFSRDYTIFALFIWLFFGIGALFQMSFPTVVLPYEIGLALQLVMTDIAARNNGRRLVTTVLAIKSTEQ